MLFVPFFRKLAYKVYDWKVADNDGQWDFFLVLHLRTVLCSEDLTMWRASFNNVASPLNNSDRSDFRFVRRKSGQWKEEVSLDSMTMESVSLNSQQARGRQLEYWFKYWL